MQTLLAPPTLSRLCSANPPPAINCDVYALTYVLFRHSPTLTDSLQPLCSLPCTHSLFCSISHSFPHMHSRFLTYAYNVHFSSHAHISLCSGKKFSRKSLNPIHPALPIHSALPHPPHLFTRPPPTQTPSLISASHQCHSEVSEAQLALPQLKFDLSRSTVHPNDNLIAGLRPPEAQSQCTSFL